MLTINVAGRIETPSGQPAIAQSLPKGTLKLKYAVSLGVGRGEQPTHAIANVAPDDLVELELMDGLRLWTRADDLERDFGVAARGGGEPGAFTLPAALPIGGPSRGPLGDWALKALNIFGVDIPGDIADFVADKVEGHLRSGPGLFRCGVSDPDGLDDVGALDGKRPTLVFLHGTASSTPGSFGGLWEGEGRTPVATLFDEHAGQVLAFEHRTLTQSPVENALDLMKALAGRLPDGARLRLVSHSRGGLVGELLCRGMLHGRGPFVNEELALFKGRTRDEAALAALGRLLASKRFQIERFVRVGCPARGTSLADTRLDRYLSVILNLLERIPGVGQSVLFDAFSSLLVAVVKKRAQPEALPGLEAQMPGSPLIRVLNHPAARCRADLHVLGGDVAGTGIWGRLKTFATDLFFREDHDLVVNTASMLGGAARTAPVRYWIDTGARVNHFSYFRNADTASRLVSALLDPGAASFHVVEKGPSATGVTYQKRAAAAPQPLVFLLPGIMGSHLRVKKNRVWLDYLDLARGGLADLGIDAGSVEPDGLVAGGYRDLVQFLADTHEVVPVAYDWRRSVWDCAATLQQAIERRIADAERTTQPIRIIAHSTGGLVVRAMLATETGARLWARMCQHPGARVVTLGTPFGGSHAIAALLMGRDALMGKLALLDLGHTHASLLEVVSRFDGVLDSLPDAGEQGVDLFDPARWRDIRQHDLAATRGLSPAGAEADRSSRIDWPIPDPGRLEQARETRARLRETTLDPARFIYVAGVAPETPCDIGIDASAAVDRRVVVYATPRGDGRVPWDTGIPAELGGGAYYMDAVHGDLANHADAFPALVDLLTAGATSKLSRTPPAPRALVPDRFVWRGELTDVYPEEDDLVAAALGGRRRGRAAAPAPKTKVRVAQARDSED